MSKLTKTTKTAIVTATENNVKVNATYTAIYDKMKVATCKRDLCDVLKMYGYDTTTTPTTTPNKNDLYIQFNEKSRLLITAKSLKVYTNNDHATALHNIDSNFIFDSVNDGSYRVKRATVRNTVENFIIIFDYFVKNNAVSVLPQRVQ